MNKITIVAAVLAVSFNASAIGEVGEDNAMPDLDVALQVVSLMLAQSDTKPHRICADAPGDTATVILLHGEQDGSDVGVELQKTPAGWVSAEADNPASWPSRSCKYK